MNDESIVCKQKFRLHARGVFHLTSYRSSTFEVAADAMFLPSSRLNA